MLRSNWSGESKKSITVNEKRVQEFLGSGIIHDTILKHPQPGVMTGLAWTSAGGEILFIETSFTKGPENHDHRTAGRCDAGVGKGRPVGDKDEK